MIKIMVIFIITIFVFVGIAEGCVRLRMDQRRPNDAAHYQEIRQEYDRVALQNEILLHNGVRNILKCTPGCCLAASLCLYSCYNLWNLKADCAANSIYCSDSYRSDLSDGLQAASYMCASACAFCGGCEGCTDFWKSNICYEKNCCKKCCAVCIQECCSLTKTAPSAFMRGLKNFFLGATD